MATGETTYVNSVREQLLAGRERLSDVLAGHESEQMLRLLAEVDSALHRIEHGSFGVCEMCAGVVPSEELMENPLARVCLECLTPKQQRALEYDLELAAQIQKGLLPPADVAIAGWEISYLYQPAGMVSGDYCDVIKDDGHLNFIMADVSGKGVAAAMLASNLRAVFRSLIPLRLPVEELMVRANRLFAIMWANISWRFQYPPAGFRLRRITTVRCCTNRPTARRTWTASPTTGLNTISANRTTGGLTVSR